MNERMDWSAKYIFLISLAAILFGCNSRATVKEEPGMVYIPGGTFMMGAKSDQSYKDEYPIHKVSVSPFYMDKTEVTNAQFKAFVDATGYLTVAERKPDWEELKKELPQDTPEPPDSLLQAGSLVFVPTDQAVNLNRYDLWWQWTIGANWKHPSGPGSNLEGVMDHPVVHIAREDAMAFAEWAGKRLPTEAEWEWAAMGGKKDAIYPWGNDPIETASDKANFWQGNFPYQNFRLDGFEGTAPVGSYPPNGYGLYDMAGNVWEICLDKYNVNSYKDDRLTGTLQDPRGPSSTFDPLEPFARNKQVVRGGSFLCNESYCSGYRTSRRMPFDQDSGANHIGFRCVKKF